MTFTLEWRSAPMPQAGSDRVLMALLELETDQDFAGPQNGQHAATLPTLDKRIDMYIDAVWGPNGTATNEMRAIARDHLLSAMAADLAEQTTASVAALPQVSVFESRRVAAISKAAASDGALHRVSAIARGLAQFFLASVDGFTLRSLRLAALPLMALLVVASVWTTSNLMNGTDQSEQDSASSAAESKIPMAIAPRTRSLAPMSSAPSNNLTAEQKLKNEIADAESAFGPAHPVVARKLVDLATLYRSQGHYQEAEALCLRALKIQQQTLGRSDLDLVRTLKELAMIFQAEGRSREAQDLLRRAEQPWP